MYRYMNIVAFFLLVFLVGCDGGEAASNTLPVCEIAGDCELDRPVLEPEEPKPEPEPEPLPTPNLALWGFLDREHWTQMCQQHATGEAAPACHVEGADTQVLQGNCCADVDPSNPYTVKGKFKVEGMDPPSTVFVRLGGAVMSVFDNVCSVFSSTLFQSNDVSATVQSDGSFLFAGSQIGNCVQHLWLGFGGEFEFYPVTMQTRLMSAPEGTPATEFTTLISAPKNGDIDVGTIVCRPQPGTTDPKCVLESPTANEAL